jgi:hypothetical protein
MSIEVTELRKGDRFLVLETVAGTFGPTDVSLVNLSVGGAQVSHPQPLRIGTRGKFTFRRGDISVVTHAHVVWSHLSRTASGMVYRSGLKLDAPDAAYAMAVNSLLRAAVLQADYESLDRKRARLVEREMLRKSQVRVIPTSTGME